MARLSPSENLHSLDSEDALSAGALSFMPRLLVLTTLPHRRPESHRFVRVSGRHRLQMSASRRVGLPYGSYARLLLAYLTTEAARTKSPEIQLGPTPNDLARKLESSTISGPRGTAHRLEDQLRRLLCMRFDWKTSLGLHPTSSGSGFVTSDCPSWLRLARELLPGRLAWRSRVVLGQNFFAEITRSAVPVDLRAIRQLQRSPLAIDLYVWLTYRMSYLKKPAVIPWESLRAQFGADYGRPRDFRRKVLAHLNEVLRVYPAVRVGQRDSGLTLYPSQPHVQSRPHRWAWGRFSSNRCGADGAFPINRSRSRDESVAEELESQRPEADDPDPSTDSKRRYPTSSSHEDEPEFIFGA